MVFELIAVVVAGFAGAGLALLVNKIAGGRLPKWVMPVAAGAAMLAVTITNEYGWYPRTTQTLPDGLEVATTVEDQAFYRPWTYVYPFVSRFLAVDTKTVRTHPDLPDQLLVDVYAFGRWMPPRKLGVAVDCAVGRRAELVEGVSFAADGSLEGAMWQDVGADDPIVRTACAA